MSNPRATIPPAHADCKNSFRRPGATRTVARPVRHRIGPAIGAPGAGGRSARGRGRAPGRRRPTTETVASRWTSRSTCSHRRPVAGRPRRQVPELPRVPDLVSTRQKSSDSVGTSMPFGARSKRPCAVVRYRHSVPICFLAEAIHGGATRSATASTWTRERPDRRRIAGVCGQSARALFPIVFGRLGGDEPGCKSAAWTQATRWLRP